MSRPRIVHLIGGLPKGGAEAQLYRLSTALRSRGWEQSVVSFDLGGVWRRPLEAAGIGVLEIRRHPFKPWRHWVLREFVARRRPGIVVSWSPHVAVYARWLGVSGLRRVFNVRGDLTVDRASGQGAGSLRWVRGALERSDAVVANSACCLSALARAGVRLPRRAVIGNIVPARGRGRAREASPCPRIAAVGALRGLKAYDVLLRALALLAREGIGFELCLAGDGPQRRELEDLAASLGLAPRVRFLGELDDASDVLADSHLLAHPSRTEGLSNAILEAMGEGLPVVACRVGGNPEIVEEGATGFLVPPGQPGALAAALRALLADPGLRGRLGAAGLGRVRARCGESGIVDRYERVFRSLR